MTITLSVPAAIDLKITLSAPVIESQLATLVSLMERTGDKLTQLETDLSNAVAASKNALAAMEQRVTGALDQLNATNTQLQQTISTLQQELNSGTIGGAGATVVQQAINDLNSETADITAFQAAAAQPVTPAPAPSSTDGSGASAAAAGSGVGATSGSGPASPDAGTASTGGASPGSTTTQPPPGPTSS
jgi:hypothetical protein